MTDGVHHLGEKRWRWYDNDRYGQKVGVVCYEHAVVVHFPAGIGDGRMAVRRIDDPDVADAYAQLCRAGLERIGEVYDELARQDGVALRRACL